MDYEYYNQLIWNISWIILLLVIVVVIVSLIIDKQTRKKESRRRAGELIQFFPNCGNHLEFISRGKDSFRFNIETGKKIITKSDKKYFTCCKCKNHYEFSPSNRGLYGAPLHLMQDSSFRIQVEHAKKHNEEE